MAQRQSGGHVRNRGLNRQRGKGRDEPTASDQECEGDCSEEVRNAF